MTQELYDGPLRSLWDEMLRSEVGVWARFNAHWLRRGLPLLAIRYEDLLLYPEEMLVRLVAFLERVPPDAVRADAAAMGRIRAAAAAVGAGKGKAATATGTGKQTHACTQQPAPPPAAAAATPTAADAPLRASDPLHANRPRGGGGIGRAMRYYSPSQVQAMCELGGGGLRAFGYDPVAQGFPHAMLSLPPYERCVKFTTPDTDTAAGPCPPPPPPAGAAALPAAAAVAAAAASGSAPVVTVNKSAAHLWQVRPADDKFGRSITKIRHALTEDDRRPLPTVQK